MAGITEYARFIEQIIYNYAQYKPALGEIEVQAIIDRENHHYLLMSVGWRGNQRVRGCVLHLDIKDGKIWIQHDGTETGVANELVALGVPKSDIALAFYAPARRPYTEFAPG